MAFYALCRSLQFWREFNNIVYGGKEELMKNLKKLRTTVGRGQYWLSEETGIERSRISLLENGRLQPTEQETAAIEKALLGAMRENIAQFSRLSGIEVRAA